MWARAGNGLVLDRVEMPKSPLDIKHYIWRAKRMVNTSNDVCVGAKARESGSDDVTLGEPRYVAFTGCAFAPLIIYHSHEILLIETS